MKSILIPHLSMYGETKKDIVEMLKKLCEMKQVDMSYLKGKSTLMLSDRHPEYRAKWGDRHLASAGGNQ